MSDSAMDKGLRFRLRLEEMGMVCLSGLIFFKAFLLPVSGLLIFFLFSFWDRDTVLFEIV